MHQEWRRLRHHHRLRLGCGQRLQRRPNGRRTRPAPQPLRRLSEAPPSPTDRARRRPFPEAGATEERLEAGPEHGLAMGHLELSGIGRTRPVSRLIRSARRAARGAPRPRRATAGGRPLRCSTLHPALQPCAVAQGTSLARRAEAALPSSFGPLAPCHHLASDGVLVKLSYVVITAVRAVKGITVRPWSSPHIPVVIKHRSPTALAAARGTERPSRDDHRPRPVWQRCDTSRYVGFN